jgi:hypothetical protein
LRTRPASSRRFKRRTTISWKGVLLLFSVVGSDCARFSSGKRRGTPSYHASRFARQTEDDNGHARNGAVFKRIRCRCRRRRVGDAF